MWKTLHAWLGVGESAPEPDTAPLRELLDALDQLDPARAQFLARFAFLLGRVARVDDSFSDVEAQAMETVLTGQAHLPAAHAALVVNLVRTSKQMFSGSTDFTVTQAFVDSASYEERLALALSVRDCGQRPADFDDRGGGAASHCEPLAHRRTGSAEDPAALPADAAGSVVRA